MAGRERARSRLDLVTTADRRRVDVTDIRPVQGGALTNKIESGAPHEHAARHAFASVESFRAAAGRPGRGFTFAPVGW